ncbi:hypothetical protein HLV40_07275 [Chromohalobacter salexigens]|nr:hypothetical protein [Chromohalobacter salexigens]
MPHDIDVTRDDIVTALYQRGSYGYESPDGYRVVELKDATEALMERDDAPELMTALFESLNGWPVTKPDRVDAAVKEWEHEVEEIAGRVLGDLYRWRLPYYRRTA